MHDAQLTKDEVSRMVGDVSDTALAAILGTGATAEDIEEALQWLGSADDVMGKSGKPLTGRPALVYDILVAEEPPDDREM